MSPPGGAADPARTPPGPSPADPTAIAVRFGVLGGLLASAFVVLPPLFDAGGGLTDYAGTMVAMLAVFFGARALATAHPGLTYGRRVMLGTTLVLVASAIYGGALYLLYSRLRPTLLAERYSEYELRVRASGRTAEQVAAELARLAVQKVQYLDPAFQAAAQAVTLAFFGLVLATYSAWRWRVAQLLAREGRPGVGPPRDGAG
jgi:hypothetical protein